MANFSDKISLTIDVVTGKSANSPFKSIRDDIDQTDGAWGKLKTGAGGAFDFVKENAAGMALGAGTAIAGFAVSAIGDFQELAGEVGSLRDSLGLSAEDASRWVEVAGDLGIGADKLETSMGKMLRTAGTSPETFKRLGVEIAYAKDGSLDANGTFLNTIDRLNGMKDPAERAAAAQELLGKSWMDSAELIELGADGVKDRLDEVSGAKILTDEQIGDSREFRDAMDDLNDQVDKLKISIAEGLVPTLSTIAGVVGPAIEAFGKLRDAAETIGDIPIAGWIVEGYLNPLGRLQDGIGLVGDAWHAVFGGGAEEPSEEQIAFINKVKEAALNMVPSVTGIQDAFDKIQADRLAAAAEQAEAATKIFNRTQEELAESSANVAAALRDQADALAEQGDKALESADASLALRDAEADLAVAIYESTATQNDSKKSSDEKRQAIESERDALIDVAKKQQEANQKAAESQGVNYTATNRLDDFNSSLLRNAQNATPAARNAIADYIIEANNVPEEKATDIRAAIARGDFDAAFTALANLSATRNAYIQADATNTAAASAELDAVANKQRVARIQAQIGGQSLVGSFATARASGGPVKKGEPYVVGEEGPEAFIPKQDGTIIPNGGGGGPAGLGGGGPVNITINAGLGTDPIALERAVMNALAATVRRNGPGSITRILKLA